MSVSELPIEPEFIRDEAISSFRRVWETAIGLPIEKRTAPLSTLSPADWMGAVAWIGGSWTGNVRIIAPPHIAEHLTKALMGHAMDPPPTEVSPNEIQDSLREIANMVAGNLKSTLPGRCGLATPGNFLVTSMENLQDEFHCILHEEYSVLDGTIVFTVGALSG